MRLGRLVLAVALVLGGAAAALAQEAYPSRAVTIVAPFPPAAWPI